MAIVPPLYDIGEVVYLKESAALGFLEAMKVSRMTRTANEWIYIINVRGASPTSVSHHGDRITSVGGVLLYFTEDELLTMCDALALAEANAQRQLTRIQAQRTNLCVEPTAGA